MIKKMCTGPHVKYPLFWSDTDETSILSKYFRKALKYQTEWKSVQWQPSSILTDRARHYEATIFFFFFLILRIRLKHRCRPGENIDGTLL